MKLIGSFLLALAPALLSAQDATPRFEFEVASVKPSPPGMPNAASIGLHVDGAQVRCTYLTLRDYLTMAYKLKIYQISGPDWIPIDRFDISAKLPEGATRENVPEMMQGLLADRFELKSHREKKEFAVYGLVAGKNGLKMKESAVEPGEAPADPKKDPVNVSATGNRGGVTVSLGRGAYFSLAENHFDGRRLTMAQIADTMARFVDRPVVDMTDAKGIYDFDMALTPEDYRAMLIRSAIAAGVQLPPQALQLLEGSSGDSLHTALAALGLKLESRKAPLEVLVVDHANRTPAAN